MLVLYGGVEEGGDKSWRRWRGGVERGMHGSAFHDIVHFQAGFELRWTPGQCLVLYGD